MQNPLTLNQPLDVFFLEEHILSHGTGSSDDLKWDSDTAVLDIMGLELEYRFIREIDSNSWVKQISCNSWRIEYTVEFVLGESGLAASDILVKNLQLDGDQKLFENDWMILMVTIRGNDELVLIP